MNTKEMRKALKEAGHKVPVKNDHVIKKYNEMFGGESPLAAYDNVSVMSDASKKVLDSVVAVDDKVVESNIYTYIGKGDTPPHMINFMGKHKFIRGQAETITDPVLSKILDGHDCFVKGTVDKDVLFKRDKEAEKEREAQIAADKKLNEEAMRLMRK